ncbi:hypothetical protein D3C76_778390 [compost metagenome]
MVTTIPLSISNPIIAAIPISSPTMNKPRIDPMKENGIATSIMTGTFHSPKATSITISTSTILTAIAIPELMKPSAISFDTPSESQVTSFGRSSEFRIDSASLITLPVLESVIVALIRK